MNKLLALVVLLSSLSAQAQEIAVKGVRLWTAPDHTRLVFDTTDTIGHSIFTLDKPHRLVIDLKSTDLRSELPDLGNENPVITRLRSGKQNAGKDVRIVLDLKAPVRPKSFQLKPNREYGHRLVVDLYPLAPKSSGLARAVAKSIESARGRDVVIAIDAGHGGEDPGAHGPRGTREKDVTLAIARKLARLVEQEEGMRPVLIRDGDYYIGLRRRMEIAHERKADLFISIHADAFRDRRVRGSSVFTLSERGASSENSADLIGGVTLEDKDDMLASVLLDLSQTATLQASSDVADEVLGELKRLGKTHKKQVQQAGFAVLKSPDIPSLLVETAFISNPTEERKLGDPKHQQKLARSLLRGIRDYFHANPPPGTLLADNRRLEHTIIRGDTLSTIAQRYKVSLNSLKEANRISGDRIRVGQVLLIPET